MLGSWQQGLLIKRFVQEVFPLVDQALEKWLAQAESSPSKELRNQAKASIASKRFHALGGSIYALYPGVDMEAFVEFVVALQTISDYLDNLCDRAGVHDEQAFRQLHIAMKAALDPDQNPQQDYYKYYPYKDDGGYLSSLVGSCQDIIKSHFPGYIVVKDQVLFLAELYADLQSLKHLALNVREQEILKWVQPYRFTELSPWEFAAATGSTLGMFMLAAAASKVDLNLDQAKQIKGAYFPWITGLHILLDYFIDLEEDRVGGDLNFVFYYNDAKECQERLNLIVAEALRQGKTLSQPQFHLSVIEGLLAMYLSDPKAFYGTKRETSKNLLQRGGFKVRLLHWICRRLRQKGKL